MRWPRWRIVTSESGDFLPALLGVIFLFISLPGFVMLLVNADRGSGGVAQLLLVLLGAGCLLGVAFIWLGISILASPGSLTYRITHGRIFFR